MHAVTITRYGGPEVLTEIELPDPHPQAGQISIDVTHAAVGMIDVHLPPRRPRPPTTASHPHRFVPGNRGPPELVREVGDGVDQFRVGERVVTLFADRAGRLRGPWPFAGRGANGSR